MKTYKYVAVIGIDGMGNFCKDTSTPNFDRIFSNGARTDYALSMDPTISAENWGGMLLGATPAVHGLTNSVADSRLYTNAALPSVFKRIRDSMGDDVYLSSVVNWNPINHGIIEHDAGVTLKTAANDRLVLGKVLREVRKKPAFLFVQFDEVDGAGHHYGYGTPMHLRKIRKLDNFTGKIYDEYIRANIIDDTLFIVIADHGGYLHGHGGYTDGEKYIFLGAAGKGVKKGKIDYAQTKDISAIVLAALGIEVPEFDENGFSSQIPDGLFKGVNGLHEKIEMKNYSFEPLKPVSPGSRGGLFSYADKNRIACAFMFEGNMSDLTGKVRVKETRNIKYYNIGVTGECAELGENGYAVTSPVSLKNGFSVSVWIRKDKAHYNETAVCSCGKKDSAGFCIYETIHDARFKIWSGGSREEYTVAFPADMESGWVNYTVSYDSSAGELAFYINFRLAAVRHPGDGFRKIKISGPFTIGEDMDHTNNSQRIHSNTVIDDLILFDTPLSEKETGKLSKYWKFK